MPIYDYRCETNGQIIEVTTKMDDLLSTWGELCDKAGIDTGETDINAFVDRIITRVSTNFYKEIITLENILPK